MVPIVILIIIGVCIYDCYTTWLSPTSQQSLFRNLKWEYSKVPEGEMAYFIFCSHFRSHYLIHGSSYPKETVALMCEMDEMLNHEKFLQEALADPNITLRAFMSKWLNYHPVSEIPPTVSESPLETPPPPIREILASQKDIQAIASEMLKIFKGLPPKAKVTVSDVPEKVPDKTREIPEVFKTPKGKQVFDHIQERGIIDNNWNLVPDPKRKGKWVISTYVLGLLVYEICDYLELDYKENLVYFRILWGNINFSDLRAKAQSSKRYGKYLKMAQELIPTNSKDI